MGVVGSGKAVFYTVRWVGIDGHSLANLSDPLSAVRHIFPILPHSHERFLPQRALVRLYAGNVGLIL